MLDGDTTIPSYVQYSRKENSVLIGLPAKRALIRDLDNTLYDAKRLIGIKYNDPKVLRDQKYWNFKIVEGKMKKPKFEIIYG